MSIDTHTAHPGPLKCAGHTALISIEQSALDNSIVSAPSETQVRGPVLCPREPPVNEEEEEPGAASPELRP